MKSPEEEGTNCPKDHPAEYYQLDAVSGELYCLACGWEEGGEETS